MKRPTPATIIACVALFFSLAGTAGATTRTARPPVPRDIAFTVRTGDSLRRCVPNTPIPVVWAWVRANGRQLIPVQAPTLYYAGDGTMVRLTVGRDNGPLCARATTWLHQARIVVKFFGHDPAGNIAS